MSKTRDAIVKMVKSLVSEDYTGAEVHFKSVIDSKIHRSMKDREKEIAQNMMSDD